MSWSKTPTKSETTKKQKYVVPQITNKWGRTEYILTPEPKKERKPRVEHENADAI